VWQFPLSKEGKTANGHSIPFDKDYFVLVSYHLFYRMSTNTKQKIMVCLTINNKKRQDFPAAISKIQKRRTIAIACTKYIAPTGWSQTPRSASSLPFFFSAQNLRQGGDKGQIGRPGHHSTAAGGEIHPP
jgi:hypothetical protein